MVGNGNFKKVPVLLYLLEEAHVLMNDRFSSLARVTDITHAIIVTVPVLHSSLPFDTSILVCATIY
jgi:hypothetical protein